MLNKESEFKLNPPDKQVEVEPIPSSPQAKPSATSSLSSRIPCRVLVVEDAPSIQVLLRKMLENIVGEVEVVENGRICIDRVQERRAAGLTYDLILMDIQMPIMNGYEAIAALQAQQCSIPVVALTAGADFAERERCLEAGFTDYLVKPIDRGELITKLRRYVSKVDTPP